MDDERPYEHLDPVVRRLSDRYRDLIGTDRVMQIVYRAYDELLEGSTITAFLPLLAERHAAAELSRLASGGNPGGPNTQQPGDAARRGDAIGKPRL